VSQHHIPVEPGDVFDRHPFTIAYLALLGLIVVSIPPGWPW
jgi:hypothetical protein